LKNKTATARLTDNITISQSEESPALDKYVKNICAMSGRTAHEYYRRLVNFQDFVISRYKTRIKTKNETGTTLDNILVKINEGSEDPYGILSDYVI
jgi:hypothetical protein